MRRTSYKANQLESLLESAKDNARLVCSSCGADRVHVYMMAASPHYECVGCGREM